MRILKVVRGRINIKFTSLCFRIYSLVFDTIERPNGNAQKLLLSSLLWLRYEFFKEEIMAAIVSVNPKAEIARQAQALAVNISAARGLQDVLKTNLGPKGTMKM